MAGTFTEPLPADFDPLRSEAAQPLGEDADPFILTMDVEGTITVDGSSLAAEMLEGFLADLPSKDQALEMRTDARTPAVLVIKFLSSAERAGLKNVKIVTLGRGGGGGKVLGQLSVSLGGSGAAGPVVPEPAEPTVPVVETPVVPPAPRVAPPSPPVERAAAKPRVARTEPVRPQPVVTPLRVQEPAEQKPVARRVPGDQGDGKPIGARSSGAPSLGEGVPSDTVGLGASDSAAGDLTDAYLALIRARIEKNRIYPSAARRSGEEGTASLRIVIDAQGRLAAADVIRRSGSFHLDRAAKRMVEKSSPFPPPPTAPFTTTIPIVFALR
eukprot:s1_g2407.t1